MGKWDPLSCVDELCVCWPGSRFISVRRGVVTLGEGSVRSEPWGFGNFNVLAPHLWTGVVGPGAPQFQVQPSGVDSVPDAGGEYRSLEGGTSWFYRCGDCPWGTACALQSLVLNGVFLTTQPTSFLWCACYIFLKEAFGPGQVALLARPSSWYVKVMGSILAQGTYNK